MERGTRWNFLTRLAKNVPTGEFTIIRTIDAEEAQDKDGNGSNDNELGPDWSVEKCQKRWDWYEKVKRNQSNLSQQQQRGFDWNPVAIPPWMPSGGIIRNFFSQKAFRLVFMGIDCVTQKLGINFHGPAKQGVVIQPVPDDLRKFWGLDCIIDCHKSITESKPRDNDQTEEEEVFNWDLTDATESIVTAKCQGSFPVDLPEDVTLCFFTVTWFKTNCWETDKLRFSEVYLCRRMTVYHCNKTLNHYSLTNLQWKRLVKSSFQSIPLRLCNETGQLILFLRRRRTNITIIFKPTM